MTKGALISLEENIEIMKLWKGAGKLSVATTIRNERFSSL